MIHNFFKIALRNMQRRKLHSFINIFGLAIGMAATILITSYVIFESSYDKFHKNYNDVYRIYSKIYLPNGESVEGPSTIGSVAPRMLGRIPDISSSVRMTNFREKEIIYNDITFTNDKFIWADSSFFDIFSFKAISGDLKTALIDEYSMVLTESMAKTIFGNEDGFNKMVKSNGNSYKITAIIEDIPVNSHFQLYVILATT